MKFVTTAVFLALALGLLSTNAVFAGAPPALTPGAFMGDFNNDGQQDVLIMDSATGALYVYVTASGIDGTPGATNVDVAQSGLLTTLTPGQSVKGVGDFNNDGRADVLIQDAAGLLVVLVNDNAVPPGSSVALDAAKTGSITTPPPGWDVIGAADANDDGNADVYVTDNGGVGGTVYTYITQAAVGGMPSVDAAGSGSPIGLPAGWVMSVVGDLNGDGLSDMMASNTVIVPPGTGLQVYTFITAAGGVTVDVAASGNPGAVPTGWGCCAAGNLTAGNASNDFAVVNESGAGVPAGLIYVYALNDDGISVDVGASAASVGLPAGWDVAGLGDFNNDGIADTLAANTDGSLLVYLNTGPGTVSGAAFLTQMPGGWSAPDFLQGMSANEVAAQ